MKHLLLHYVPRGRIVNKREDILDMIEMSRGGVPVGYRDEEGDVWEIVKEFAGEYMFDRDMSYEVIYDDIVSV